MAMPSKRSQMRIQEMSFMIIAIAVFFILVLLFYLTISLGNLRELTTIPMIDEMNAFFEIADKLRLLIVLIGSCNNDKEV